MTASPWTEHDGLTGPEYRFARGGTVLWAAEARRWEYWLDCRVVLSGLAVDATRTAVEEWWTWRDSENHA